MTINTKSHVPGIESPPRSVCAFALVGGLIQGIMALALLFLPVFATCYIGDSTCRYQSYVQLGGSVLGYSLLALMMLLGAVVATLSVRKSTHLTRRILWLAAIGSFVTVVLGSWSIGFVFLPGGLLLLIAAIRSRVE